MKKQLGLHLRLSICMFIKTMTGLKFKNAYHFNRR